MTNPKTIRVEIETDDGEIYKVVGEEAEKWKKAVDGLCSFGYVHGILFPWLKYEVIKTNEPNRI
jgi:hypothetical protein